MRRMVLVLLLTTAPAAAEQFTVFGFGSASCGKWLSNEDSYNQGFDWILGFWSGANGYGVNHIVGASTADGYGIVGVVKQRCEANPAQSLVSTVQEIYGEFRDDGK